MKKLSVFILALFLAACTKETPADLIVFGGPIYTVEQSNPQVEALAVRGDSIVFVGTRAEAEKFKGENTQEIDLKGKTLTPGFIEGHGHFLARAISSWI